MNLQLEAHVQCVFPKADKGHKRAELGTKLRC